MRCWSFRWVKQMLLLLLPFHLSLCVRIKYFKCFCWYFELTTHNLVCRLYVNMLFPINHQEWEAYVCSTHLISCNSNSITWNAIFACLILSWNTLEIFGSCLYLNLSWHPFIFLSLQCKLFTTLRSIFYTF